MRFGLPRFRTLAVAGVGAFAGNWAYGFLFKEGEGDAGGFIPLPAPNAERFDVTDVVRFATIGVGVVMALKLMARGK
jgi:hypothetical protein